MYALPPKEEITVPTHRLQSQCGCNGEHPAPAGNQTLVVQPTASHSGSYPPPWPGFEPRSSNVGFMVDKVELRQVFSEYLGFPCQFSFHRLLHIHHNLTSWAGTKVQLVANVPSGLSPSSPQEIRNYSVSYSDITHTCTNTTHKNSDSQYGSHSAPREIFYLLRNPKVQYRIHKSFEVLKASQLVLLAKHN
jgi:hypothetical protein